MIPAFSFHSIIVALAFAEAMAEAGRNHFVGETGRDFGA
jgi:hypothetical protein